MNGNLAGPEGGHYDPVRGRLYSGLSVNDRAAAVAAGFERGLLPRASE